MKRLFGKKNDELPRRRQLDVEQRAKQRQAEGTGSTLFRRNRTITGSLSSSVTSATELNANADLMSPRAHVHHLSAHRRRLSAILTMVVVGSLFLIWLLYEFIAGVHISATNNGIVIDETRYQKAITAYLNTHPIERFRFVLNEKQLAAYLRLQVPEVSDVTSGGAAGFATGQFDITFRQPVASWLIGSNQYYVDKDGVSYQVNYFEQPTVKIIDQSGVPQVAGTAIASTRFLQFVGRTVNTAQVGGLVVEQAIIPSGTTRQIEVKVAGHSYPVKLSLDRPVGEQVEDMERALKYFDSKGQSPEYIDVRVSGKAFYK